MKWKPGILSYVCFNYNILSAVTVLPYTGVYVLMIKEAVIFILFGKWEIGTLNIYKTVIVIVSLDSKHQWPLLLTSFNFDPSMDK